MIAMPGSRISQPVLLLLLLAQPETASPENHSMIINFTSIIISIIDQIQNYFREKSNQICSPFFLNL
jgi:hypothetical protein